VQTGYHKMKGWHVQAGLQVLLDTYSTPSGSQYKKAGTLNAPQIKIWSLN